MDDREQMSPADRVAIELYEQCMGDLARGTWTTDLDVLKAATEAAESYSIKALLANLVTHRHFTTGKMEAALDSAREWVSYAPGEASAQNSLISVLLRLGRFEELVEAATSRLDDEPDNFRLRSSLANAHWQLGNEDKAREFGNAALALQDGEVAATKAEPIPVTVPSFNPAARERNIISFSLYGNLRKYVGGAIENAKAAQLIYPEWTCRFYVDDSVPPEAIQLLRDAGCQIHTVKGLPAARYGTFWRFLVADDREIDRYIVRDCDTVLNLRDRNAVEQWTVSGKHFHLMRDSYAHTWLVLAGMWGGVRGALPPMLEAIVDYCETAPFARTADQSFLRERVWPTMRQSLLSHDSTYHLGDSQDFPLNLTSLG